MKKNIYLILTCVVIASLLLVLILTRRNEFTIVELGYKNILSDIETNGASILYTKELNKDVSDRFKAYYDEYKLISYYSEMNLTQINDLLKEYELSTENDNVFILFMNGIPVEVIDATDETRTKEMIDKHLYNIIPENERVYKVLSTANQYIKKVNSKDYTIAVFGVNNCTYCDLYLPVINNIAKDYNLDIYYFNRDEYDEDEYEKIMELDFEIPSKCTTTGYPTSMKKSFPKPMTIITKSGEFVDCIRGYVTEDTVLDMLKEYKIVKE